MTTNWRPFQELQMLLAVGEIGREEFLRERRALESACEHAGWVCAGLFCCIRCGAEFAADVDPHDVSALPLP